MRQLKLLTRLVVLTGLMVSATAAIADLAPAAPTAPAAPAVAVTNAPAIKAAVMPVAPAAPAAAPALLASQKAFIEQTMHDYLLAHPEILMEMSQKLQAQQQQATLDKAAKVIPANVKILAHDAQSPVSGNALGSVTVVQFFDYQCPHCKAMVPIMDALVLANKNVRVVYKEMPIFGPESEFAARAALAANKQGKYAAFHHALMKTEGRLSNEQVLDIAKSVGIDSNKMQAVMNSADISKELKETGMLAQLLGLPGTPAFVVLTEQGSAVTSRFIPGQTDQVALQQAINAVSVATPVKAAAAQ